MPTLVTRGAASVRGFGFAGTSPVLPDPYFNYTTLLLHGNGTNGGQNNTFLDSGTANGGVGFDITRNGNTTQGTFSPFSQTGWSNYFDGSGDYLNTATNVSGFDFGTGDFTVECWVYHLALSSQCVIFYGVPSSGSLPASDFGWAIDTASSNTPRFFFYSGSTQVTVSAAQTMPINQWVHYAATRASGSLKFFINGTQSGSTVSSSASVNTNTTFATRIGLYGPYGDDRYFNGYMSNLRVVKGTAVYTSNFTPPTAPLTAISGTSLLTCQSNRFVDNSASPLTLTVNGNTSVQAFSPFAPTAAYSASTVGGSGYFDGSGDYLDVQNSNDFDTNTSFTLECWVYTGGNGCMFSRGGGSASWSTSDGHQFIFYISSGVLRWQFNSSGSPVTMDSAAIPLNSWVHCAVGYNGTTTRLWLNGASAATSTSSYTMPTTRNIIRSGLTSSNDQPYTGYISGLRFVKSDVYGVSNTSITIPTAPLTNITDTKLLLNFTNAAIIDNTAKNVLETVGNAQISTSVSKFGGGSMSFDGSGDWLTGPNTPNLYIGSGNFTIEGWLYLNTTGSEKGIVSQFNAGGSGPGWTLYIKSSNVLEFYGGVGTVTVTGTTTLSATTWTHFAVVRSGSTITIYVNGTAGGSATNSSFSDETSGLMYIGSRADNPSAKSLNGYIDDLRITKGIARYTSNFTPQTSQWQDQ
jgi:hypothetical protein